MGNIHLLLLGCYLLCIGKEIFAAPADIDPLSLVVSSTEASVGKDGDKVETNIPTVPQIYQMHVNSKVSNRFAHTTITSKVRNVADKAQEADFTVILPENAFISGFIMEVDGKNYTAYVREKEEAKRDYDRAVSSGLGAAHVAVSARDSNRFTVSVNVEPETKAAFYLTYEELLKRKDSRYELIINIHPRQPVEDLTVEVAINESRKLKDLKAPPLRSGNEIVNGNAELDPRADIEVISDTQAVVKFSPSLETQKQLAHSMKTDEKDGLSGQFVVQYDVERDPTGGEVLIRDGYFVHFFAPTELETLPKHIVFVLDTSGSMSGRKIVQLKEAMHKILDQLHENDTFNLIEFNYNAKVCDLDDKSKSVWYPYQQPHYGSYQDLADIKNFEFPIAYTANPENIDQAKKSVSDFNPMGGTNIYDSLKVALYLAENEKSKPASLATHKQSMVMFLTDGGANVGEFRTSADIIDRVTEINSAESSKIPIFSLAFGSGADKTFLQKLSLKNYGFSKQIYEAADASLQLQDFYNQISSPLLAGVTFKYEASVKELTKTDFPVLYGGSEMVVAGHYTELAEVPYVECWGLQGRRMFKPVVSSFISDIERLWAYLTVKQLLEKKEAGGQGAVEAKQQALALALKYSFVTPISSLVVVKPNAENAVDTEEADRESRRSGSRGGGRQGLAPLYSSHSSGYVSPRTGGVLPVQYHAISAVSRPESDRVYYSAIPRIARPSPKEDLLRALPWLRALLDNNDLLVLPSGNFKLGLNETIAGGQTCLDSSGNETGRCTLLKGCPQVYSVINSKEEYIRHSCVLQIEYAGVCCPSTALQN